MLFILTKALAAVATSAVPKDCTAEGWNPTASAKALKEICSGLPRKSLRHSLLAPIGAVLLLDRNEGVEASTSRVGLEAVSVAVVAVVAMDVEAVSAVVCMRVAGVVVVGSESLSDEGDPSEVSASHSPTGECRSGPVR